MNFFTKLKNKKKGKKTKAAKKKLMTAGELFITGGLWTAGGNIVDSITEDSSTTQITANKVSCGKMVFQQRDPNYSHHFSPVTYMFCPDGLE